MIVYTFTGNFQLSSSDKVNIIYEPSNRIITAQKTNGATPRVTYSSYEKPDDSDLFPGDLLSEFTEGDELVKVFFRDSYPFGYVEVSEITPESEVITINAIGVTPQSEQGINDGIAIISASGGTPPYSYSINGVDYQSSNTFSNLSPGTYTAYVKSDVDPVTSQAFTIIAADLVPPEVEPIVKDLIVQADGEINIQNAYKRVEVESTFGGVPSLLLNGDFEQWDGQNFLFWTRYGGLNFSRVQRTVTNANGVSIPINNWAIRFNERANANKFYQSSAVPVKQKDSIRVSFRVSKMNDLTEYTTREQIVSYPPRYRVHNFKTFYAAKIRIKVGNYYLYNKDYSSNLEWTTGISTVSIDASNRTGDLGTFQVSFQVPEVPVSDNIFIQLFGFEKVLMDSNYIEGSGVTNPNNTTTYQVLDEYTAITMDDLEFAKNSDPKDNDVVGLLSVSENLNFYTEKPDKIDILFGDFFNSAAGASQLSNLYAIYVGNKASIGWYEYGTTNGTVAFSLALAKSILRGYQKPFIMYKGDFHLKPMASELGYLNTIMIDVPGQRKFSEKVFTFLGGDFDLKTNQALNVTLAETFDRPGKSNDITVPSYPGTTPPIFVQDPTGNTNITGIFTDEFTQQFK